MVKFDTVFQSEYQVLTVRLQGIGDAATVPQMVAAIMAAPEYRPGMPVLIDALNTDFAPSVKDAAMLPGFFEKELPGSRLGALVQSAGRQHAIASVVETLASRRNVPLFAVFTRRDDAMQWLTAKP